MTPWYNFWKPSSGPFGGMLFAVVIFAAALVIAFLWTRFVHAADLKVPQLQIGGQIETPLGPKKQKIIRAKKHHVDSRGTSYIMIESEGARQWITMKGPSGSLVWVEVSPQIRKYIMDQLNLGFCI